MCREYPKGPIVGVGAIIFSQESVLLVQRGREPAKGEWSIPGGKVELGETLTQAIVREVDEETGLTVRPVALVKTLERIFRDPDGKVKYHYVLCDFRCEVLDGDPKPASDAAAVQFVPLAELSKYRVAPITMKVIFEALNASSSSVYAFPK